MTREQILHEVASLPHSEQVALAVDLWELTDPASADGPLSDELCDELDRRLAADDADDSPGEPWEVARAKLLRREF